MSPKIYAGNLMVVWCCWDSGLSGGVCLNRSGRYVNNTKMASRSGLICASLTWENTMSVFLLASSS